MFIHKLDQSKVDIFLIECLLRGNHQCFSSLGGRTQVHSLGSGSFGGGPVNQGPGFLEGYPTNWFTRESLEPVGTGDL